MVAITNGPSPLDWKVYAGDRNAVQFAFTAAGQPWVLTGAQLTAQARLSVVDEAVALTAVITIDDDEGGLATIAWPGDTVTQLLAGADKWAGIWDLQLLEAGQPLPTTVLRGKLTAALDVTRIGVG